MYVYLFIQCSGCFLGHRSPVAFDCRTAVKRHFHVTRFRLRCPNLGFEDGTLNTTSAADYRKCWGGTGEVSANHRHGHMIIVWRDNTLGGMSVRLGGQAQCPGSRVPQHHTVGSRVPLLQRHWTVRSRNCSKICAQLPRKGRRPAGRALPRCFNAKNSSVSV